MQRKGSKPSAPMSVQRGCSWPSETQGSTLGAHHVGWLVVVSSLRTLTSLSTQLPTVTQGTSRTALGQGTLALRAAAPGPGASVAAVARWGSHHCTSALQETCLRAKG